MEQDNSQKPPLMAHQSTVRDTSNSRRKRTNSFRGYVGADKEDQRSRGSSPGKNDSGSETSRYNRARGPINDAVHSALDPIDPNHTTIPPEILNQITSQITASVLQQLKANQFSPPTSYPPPNTTDVMDSTSSIGTSPPIDRAKVYTPPSPYRASVEAARAISPTSPRKPTHVGPSPDVKRPPSPPFSHGALSEDSDARESKPIRPKSDRSFTGGDATILEKIWGELFDKEGQPTIRLSQFLRGIAVHLIEDYDPKHSLVISPEKMQRYYAETKLATEIYPWQVVFDDRTSSLSRMYREIEAQHHLVQERLNERPDIPGLTPIGFEKWMTLVLKAHPNEEFERLAYTALHMPVNNPDDLKERFPKELSRRQFPKEADISIGTRLQKVMYTHCGVRPPARNGSISEKETKPPMTIRTNDVAPQKPVQPDYSLSQTSTRSSVPEIDRNALRPTVSEAAVDDSPIEIISSQPIERERKPYVAQPGGGKSHENSTAQIQPADSRTSHILSAPPPKLERSTSLSNGRDPKLRPVQPISVHQKPMHPGPPPSNIDIPASMRTRTGSLYHRDAPRQGERNRSPSNSRTNDYPHKSDGDVSYGSYHEQTPTAFWSDNRYEGRQSFSVDPRERERERDRQPRERYNSIGASDGHRHHPSKDYPSDDEYYRAGNSSYTRPDASYPPGQCPPNSYRSRV